MQVICPVCRSVLEPYGHFDLAAPYGQRVPCPICSYPIDLTTGLPAPTRFDGFNIITAYKPVVAWADVQKSAETKAASLGLQSSISAPASNASFASDFSISDALAQSASAITKGIGEGIKNVVQPSVSTLQPTINYAIMAAAGVVLILLLFRKSE